MNFSFFWGPRMFILQGLVPTNYHTKVEIFFKMLSAVNEGGVNLQTLVMLGLVRRDIGFRFFFWCLDGIWLNYEVLMEGVKIFCRSCPRTNFWPTNSWQPGTRQLLISHTWTCVAFLNWLKPLTFWLLILLYTKGRHWQRANVSPGVYGVASFTEMPRAGTCD